jgi:hypothetical protein
MDVFSTFALTLVPEYEDVIARAERKPWEAIARRFPVRAVVELYGGAAYNAVGEKS